MFAFGRGTALVQTVDFFTPIVDDPYDFGRIAAANSLSDVYAMGGKPLTALGLVCFPDDRLPVDVLAQVLRGGEAVMRQAGVAVVGGHSVRDKELKFGYAVTGVVARRRILSNAGARPGDRLVLTKLLGTGILSTALKRELLPAPLERRLTRGMVMLNRTASECAVEFGVRAATDVTGFGFLGHASQMADASGVTFRVHPAASWLLPRVADFARDGIVPGGLDRNREFYAPRVAAGGTDAALIAALYDTQTSGGLLLSVSARRAEGLVRRLKSKRVPAIAVGEVVRRREHAVEIVSG